MDNCNWDKISIVGSNAIFLLTPLYMLYENKFKLKTNDLLLACIVTYLTAASTLYHMCDDANGEVKCIMYCITNVNDLYFLDSLGATMSVYVPLLYNLDTDDLKEMNWLIPYVIFITPIGVILFNRSWTLFVFASGLAVFLLLYRLWLLTNYNISIMNVKALLEDWTYYEYSYLSIIILVITTGVLFQLRVFGIDYIIEHPLWHCFMGIGLVLGCIIITRLKSLKQQPQDKIVSGYAKLTSHKISY